MRIKHFIYFVLSFSFSFVKAQELDVTLIKTDKECVLGKAEVIINSGTSPFQVVWSNGSILNTIENLEEGQYSVTIADGNSKDTTIRFVIGYTICEPIPSNNFTPNGDLYNDTWSIVRIEYFPEFELYVYNRWGQQVHHQSSNYEPWDGTSLGLPLPDGTYYYVLFFSKSNKNKFIKGDVSILR